MGTSTRDGRRAAQRCHADFTPPKDYERSPPALT
jgi:hypothetical protein